MLGFLVPILLSLYLFSLPIRVKVKGLLDLSAGHGEVSFSVFYITIFKAKGLMEHFSLTSSDFVIMLQNKKKKVHVEMKKQTFSDVLKSIRSTDLSFLGNLDVKDVYLSVHYGQADAFLTTVAVASARVLFYSAMSALKSNQRVEITEEFVPVYNIRAFKMDFHGIFSLSVADIIYGYIMGKLKKLRRSAAQKERA